jgi:hypothetical protein
VSEADDIAALRSEILTRFRTVHQFCRRMRGTLNRATVYMLLAGTYGGDVARQARRFRAALEGRIGPEERAFQAIKETACARCRVRGSCARCDDLFRAQAQAAVEAAFSTD